MRSRRILAMIEQLAVLERVRRASAEAALCAARAQETDAALAAERAADGADVALHGWLDHVGGTDFSPERSRALSAHLIDLDHKAAEASRREALCAAATLRREADFHQAEARTRARENEVRTLRREMGRAQEENRLSRLADRITYLWRRG